MKSYKDIIGDGGSDVAGQVTEQRERMNARLASVQYIIAVMSGKGGVGKSSLAVNLAAALAIDGHAVGVLDADINGSSVPKIAGVRGRALERGATGMIPPTNSLNMKVVSIDLLLADDRAPVVWDATTQHDAYTWRGMMEMGTIREFLTDTEWGALDYLFIDLPPGTDKLPNIAGLLPRISGTVVVTIPSSMSQFVVAKSIRLARDLLNAPIAGLVENMSSYVCAHCGEDENLFGGDDVAQFADDEAVPFLGRIPFDPRIAAAADAETPFMIEHGDTPAGRSLRGVANAIKSFVEQSAAA